MSKVKSTYKGVVNTPKDQRLQPQKSRWLCRSYHHFGYLNPIFVDSICKKRNCHYLVDLSTLPLEGITQ